ncbi:MAG: MFS transporter [Clostridia bacterium]|nr:MFS transporter [Clostridia bacterium]
MVLGNSMLIPLLPRLKEAMDLTLAEVGLLITAFSLPAGLTIPLAGLLSDRFGRKAILVPALAVYGLGGALAGLAILAVGRPYFWVLLARVIQGVGAGGTYQLAMALTGDLYQQAARVRYLGLLETGNGVGKAVSPILGAALGLISLALPFFVYGFLSWPAAAAVALLVRERPRRRQVPGWRAYFQTVWQVLSARGQAVVPSFLAGMGCLFVLFGTLSYASDLLELRYGLRGMGAGLALAVPVGVMAFTSYLAGNYLGERLDRLAQGIALGLLAVAVSLALLTADLALLPLLLALLPLGAGTGMVLPAVNTVVTGLVAQEERGLVTCLYGALRFFGVALGPPAFGMVLLLGRTSFFGTASLAVALLAVLAAVLIRPRAVVPPELSH